MEIMRQPVLNRDQSCRDVALRISSSEQTFLLNLVWLKLVLNKSDCVIDGLIKESQYHATNK